MEVNQESIYKWVSILLDTQFFSSVCPQSLLLMKQLASKYLGFTISKLQQSSLMSTSPLISTLILAIYPSPKFSFKCGYSVPTTQKADSSRYLSQHHQGVHGFWPGQVWFTHYSFHGLAQKLTQCTLRNCRKDQSIRISRYKVLTQGRYLQW